MCACVCVCRYLSVYVLAYYDIYSLCNFIITSHSYFDKVIPNGKCHDRFSRKEEKSKLEQYGKLGGDFQLTCNRVSSKTGFLMNIFVPGFMLFKLYCNNHSIRSLLISHFLWGPFYLMRYQCEATREVNSDSCHMRKGR